MVKSNRDEGDLTLFLHKQGYNFFNLGRLTWTEINALVTAWNRVQEKEKRELDKAKRKGRKT